MPPRVVFALQAPTLLNILAQSTRWRLEVADLGDTAIAEKALLTAPAYSSGDADVVVVATPTQFNQARARFPRSLIWWAIHNGRPEMVTADAARCPILVFSNKVMELQLWHRPELRVRAVRPCYSPAPVWKWRPGCAWMLLNRPATREHTRLSNDAIVEAWARVTIARYGEGQPHGFLKDKSALLASSSCYVSSLPFWAGFGLAQHECFAAGVPLVCSRWGDAPLEMQGYPGLSDSLYVQARVLSQLARDGERLGRELSEVGLSYIAERRTAAIMDQEIAEALEVLR